MKPHRKNQRVKGSPASPDKKQRNSKIIRFSISPFWLLLILIPVLLYGGLRFKYGSGLGIYRVSRESSSETMDIRARNLYRISTVEFVWKTVFPHDFFPPDEEWNSFLLKMKNSQTLTAKEAGWVEFYDLCLATGYSLKKESTEFLVLTLLVQAGYDLESTPLAGETAAPSVPTSPAAQVPFLEIQENRIYLSPPGAKILSVVMEDPERESYPFPDSRVSPEGLQQISRFVSSRAESLAVNRRLLEKAEENGRMFLRRIFEEAGFSEVIFR